MSLPLATQIADYYFEHSPSLTPGQRFHLASRLQAWTGDKRAQQLVEASRSFIVPPTTTPAALAMLFRRLRDTPLPEPGKVLAYALRRPYFEHYTPLYGLEQALFRLRHLDAVYGIDGRDAFLQELPLSDLAAREHQLMQDPAALRALSTYAVNYVYLLRRVLLQDDGDIDTQLLYDLGDSYNTDDEEQLRLLIYLYTHCILGESNFYARAIPPTMLPVYRAMLSRLDSLIGQHFDSTSLDAKLEFLVCCRLCQHTSPLAERIYAECERSISPQGTFLIDTHNSFAGQIDKQSLGASEHRNVLFIMSTSAFTPHSPLSLEA